MVEVELPLGTAAEFETALVIQIDLSQFRRIDMIHEGVHVDQLERMIKSGVDPVKNPYMRYGNPHMIAVAEQHAYEFELQLARQHHFANDYKDFILNQIERYWGRKRNKFFWSEQAQQLFEVITGKPYIPGS